MRFAVVTLGSAGDLHPFLAIARALVERGHQVHLLSQAPYETAVRAEGVGFIAIAGEKEHVRTLKHPLLWHPLNGFGVLWRHLAVPAIGPTIDALEALSHDQAAGPLVVLASPLAVGARLARERWPHRIRLVSGYTAPMGLRSTDDPMFLGAWEVPRWAPGPVRCAFWKALDRWKLEPMARPALNRWCERLGVPRFASSSFGDSLHSPDGGLALYPPWFAPVPEAWRRRRVHQVGFPVFEPRQALPPSHALADFLADPRPYVVAYPGSADQRAQAFASRVRAASRSLGHRTLVLTPFSQTQELADGDSLRVDAAPLPKVLPGALAFVHHGGIGSIAQGLSADVPQLVLASAYDQFENGARLQALGNARWQREASATPESVRRALDPLCRDRWREGPPPLELSHPGHPNTSVEHATELLEHMHQQLSFPDLEPDAERFPVDAVPSQGRRLQRYTLLLALFPPAEATERIDAVAADLVARHSITGSRTAPGRLHVTLHEIAQFASGPDVPAAPIKASIAACDRIAGRAFPVSCSAVGTYPHSNAFVLHCDAATNDAIAALRDAIQVELRRFNLRPRASKDAHMTLVYGARRPQPRVLIEPVRWTATRFALVLSHVGVTHHQWIKEWALGVNEVAG